MYHIFLVAAGGAVGAAMRHLVNIGALRWLGPGFPWGTLSVNVAGSLAMGLLAGWLARRVGGSSNELRLLLATGVLGGFTTFSAFSLDVATLWDRGDAGLAATYAAVSVLLSVAGLFGGLALMRAMA
jgi:CrcB protein